MKFRSEINIVTLNNKIKYSDNLLFLGSCFSGNIGNKFHERLFNTKINPFGVIFNPISILKLIERAIDKNYFNENDWIYRNEKWLNLDLHGDLSFTDLDKALSHSNNIIDEVHNFLKTTDCLFLTFGTAWIYSFRDNNQLVANCHKIPQKEFEKSLLSVTEIVEYGNSVISKIKNFVDNTNRPKSQIKIIFTVSPVRHLADGAHNNNLSKSSLHLAINELLKLENTEYFPSYELVIDELRDYRFYTKDLMHPNDFATDFVWEKLLANWIEPKTQVEIQEIEKLISSVNHRPFNMESIAHQKFVTNTLLKLSVLKNNHPNLNFEKLEFSLQKQLI